MKLKEKTKRKIRICATSILVICIAPIFQSVENISGASTLDEFSGKDIVCAIDLNDDIHGYQTSMTYEVLEKFAQESRCNVRIVASDKKTNYIDSLKTGKVDIVVKTVSDSLEDNVDIMISREIGRNTVWAVSSEKAHCLRQVNSWISHFTQSDEFGKIQKKYFRAYNPYRLAENSITTNTLSPYDCLIKKYAAQLGWDWKMLAAVIYQESRFSIGTKSHRGATGLMQVMPQTAKIYGVDNLLDPEQNLYAGTAHLKRLQEMMKKNGIEGEELIKFTLAAYNAGEGRIADCLNFAKVKDVDCNQWEEIVNLIPLMREDSILEEKSVKLGKFQGYETIAYVDSIMSIYEQFQTVCPAN